APGSTGHSIHHATASSIRPKPCLTLSIHGPAFGNKVPADAPASSNGTPMPQARKNKARPPSTTSCVCEIYSRIPASGAATHGPTIKADTAPSSTAADALPPGRRWLQAFNAVCHRTGAWKVKTPNIDSASKTSSTAKTLNIHGVCKAAARLSPVRPASTPMTVYTTDIPSTYRADKPNPLPRAGLPPALCPTRKADKIGTIGNTHGVKDSSSPSPKNTANTCQRRPCSNAEARPTSSCVLHPPKEKKARSARGSSTVGKAAALAAGC